MPARNDIHKLIHQSSARACECLKFKVNVLNQAIPDYFSWHRMPPGIELASELVKASFMVCAPRVRFCSGAEHSFQFVLGNGSECRGIDKYMELRPSRRIDCENAWR